MPSTAIAAMRYNEGSATLLVVFVTGRAYKYLRVPKTVFTAMQKATSKGGYLNSHIKGRFDYEELK